MILYTVLNPEEVLGAGKPSAPEYRTVKIGTRVFIVELCDGETRIVRLLSADPADYLNPKWQPGSDIGFFAWEDPGPRT